jgi:hypothetical protein
MNGRCKEVASKIELQRRLAELNRLLRQLNKLEELVRDFRDKGIAKKSGKSVKKQLNSTYQSAPRAIVPRSSLVPPAVPSHFRATFPRRVR